MKINPTISEMESADIDLIVAGSMKDVVMVEGEMNEVSEAEMVEAIKFAHEAIKLQCQAQLELREMTGNVAKENITMKYMMRNCVRKCVKLLIRKYMTLLLLVTTIKTPAEQVSMPF